MDALLCDHECMYTCMQIIQLYVNRNITSIICNASHATQLPFVFAEW